MASNLKVLLLLTSYTLWKCSPQCTLRPLPGPEIRYDFNSCSIFLDWRRHTSEECRFKTVLYEVQYITSCTNASLSQTRRNSSEKFAIPDKIPGECSKNSNCYARVRFMLNDGTWSDYSAWTTLSKNYEKIRTCVKKDTRICFPINANCTGDGALPEFIINREHLIFQKIVESRQFNISYGKNGYSFCFENVTENVFFIEFCPIQPDCTSFQSPVNGELVIEKVIEIEVEIDRQCTTCYDIQLRMASVATLGAELTASLQVQKNKCSGIAFSEGMQSWINNGGTQNVCISTDSEGDTNNTSVIITLQLEAANDTSGKGYIRSIQKSVQYQSNMSYCQHYDHTGHFELSVTATNEGSIAYIPFPCTDSNPTPTTYEITTVTRNTGQPLRLSVLYNVILCSVMSLHNIVGGP